MPIVFVKIRRIRPLLVMVAFGLIAVAGCGSDKKSIVSTPDTAQQDQTPGQDQYVPPPVDTNTGTDQHGSDTALSDTNQDTTSPVDAPLQDTPMPDQADGGPQPDWPPTDVVYPDPVPYGGWDPLVYAGAILGSSVQNRPIMVERFGGDAGPVVFLFHTIHGRERPAEQVGERMRTWLLLHPEQTDDLQVLFITLANPDGYSLGTRHNANNINLNRNFPASNFEPTPEWGPYGGSEPETQLLVAMVQDSEPTAIVTVHSPYDVINWDGPAEELATWCADASGMEVWQDLGPYPGSFGSFAGIDLGIPTITLETDVALPTLDSHLDDLIVEQMTIEWVREQGGTGVPLSDIVVDLDANDDYEVMRLGDSPAHRPFVAERFGTYGQPVLVVGGMDGTDHGVFVAERLRALLLDRSITPTPAGQVILVTVANPDGVVAGRPLDNDDLDPDRSFPEGFEPGPFAGIQPLDCVESALIADLVGQEQPAAVFVVLGTDTVLGLGVDGPGMFLEEAALTILADDPQEDVSARPGSLAAWAGSQNIPALTVAFPELPAAEAVYRANNAALSILAAIDMVQNPGAPLQATCVVDYYCNPTCYEDTDCSCDCDYWVDVCEANEPCTSYTCDCDLDCSAGHQACEADGHCDTWCPTDGDPDCIGDPGNGAYCASQCECTEDECCDPTCPDDPDCAGGCWDAPACLEAPSDGTCQWACMHDPDCYALTDAQLLGLGFDGGSASGACDYNAGFCEPTYRCVDTPLTPDQVFTVNGVTVVQPCPNDPDCAGATVWPCQTDGYCDSWCPCNLDPDCAVAADCCSDLSCVD